MEQTEPLIFTLQMMNEITREMAYLCIGEDLEKIDLSELTFKVFKGIKYYLVDDYKVIEHESQLFCSCNESYCWHIFKIVLDKDKAKLKTMSSQVS